MGLVDLTDAYHVVSLATADQKFMKFVWRNVLYKFTCLAFGLSLAPRKFTKLMKPVMSTLRQRGLTIANYLDDLFQAERTFELCKSAIQISHELLCNLGFIPNDSKSVYIPTQVIEMLGFIINSITMRLHLPEKKSTRVINLCGSLLHSKKCTIKHLCVVIGVIISCFPAVPLGQMFYRNLERCKLYYLCKHHGNYNAMCNIDFKCMKELEWWCTHSENSSAPINRGPPEIMITTDASLKGWGSSLASKCAHRRFNLQESCYTINTKETLAIYLALRSFAHEFKGKHVLIKLDSTTAISYIKKMGGMESLLRDQIATETWKFATNHNMWITITHLAGKLNLAADENSRIFNDNLEWEISQTMFESICNHFYATHGSPTCNLFASRLNYKLPKSMSFGPDPYLVHVDAFTIRWNTDELLYMYLPFNLISRCLQKLEQDQATALILFPFWTTQIWFTRMLELLTTPLYLLPKNAEIRLPWDHSIKHPLRKNL